MGGVDSITIVTTFWSGKTLSCQNNFMGVGREGRERGGGGEACILNSKQLDCSFSLFLCLF